MTGVLDALAGCGAEGLSAGGFRVTAAPASVVSPFSESASVTATPAGGTGPYTCSWSLKSGSSPSIHIRTPDVAATTFYCFDHGGEKDGIAICSVLDTATGKTATSNDVVVILMAGGS